MSTFIPRSRRFVVSGGRLAAVATLAAIAPMIITDSAHAATASTTFGFTDTVRRTADRMKRRPSREDIGRRWATRSGHRHTPPSNGGGWVAMVVAPARVNSDPQRLQTRTHWTREHDRDA
jgi:hypothetical protein